MSMSVTAILGIVFQFLPILVELAEKLFDKNGSGAEKKDFVISTLPKIASGIGAISTGGQKETWELINANMDSIGRAVDVTAGALFPNDEEAHG